MTRVSGLSIRSWDLSIEGYATVDIFGQSLLPPENLS